MFSEKLTIGKDIRVMTDSVPVKKRSEFLTEYPWWGKADPDNVFGLHIEVPISTTVRKIYTVPDNITHLRLLCLMPEVMALDKQTAFERLPFSKSLQQLLGLPDVFFGFGYEIEVPESLVSGGLDNILSVMFGRDKNSEYAHKVRLALSQAESSVLASIFIHGTNLNRDGEFVVGSKASGFWDFFPALPALMASFEKTYSEPMEVIALLHLMMCNMRHVVAGTPISPEDEPDEVKVFASQFMSGIPPQEVNVKTTPVLQTDKFMFAHGSVYQVTEEVALLNNPLAIPMSYALDTVMAHIALGRAMTFPDGTTVVGE